MIDTVEILYSFSQPEARVLLSLCSIPFRQEQVEHFLNLEDSFHFLPNPTRKQLDAISPGILKFSFTHNSSGIYFLRMVLHLEAMLEGKRTNRLYVASPRNNQLLRDTYACSLFQIFPGIEEYAPYYRKKSFVAGGTTNYPERNYEDFYEFCNMAQIPYLWLSSVKKVDYSVNLKVDNKAKFLKYAKKTFLEGGRLKLRSFKGNNNIFACNKSKKILLYDKQLKYHEKGCDNAELVDEVADIVRYEVRIKPNKERTLKLCGLREKNIQDGDIIGGLLPWLSEDIAWKVLSDTYVRHIGTAKWVNRYTFNKIIEASDLGKSMKESLKLFGELVGQSKSVRYAEEQFLKGKVIGKSHKKHSVVPAVDRKDENAVRNRKRLFAERIKTIRKLAVQPVRLTDKEGAELPNPFREESFSLVGHQFRLTDRVDDYMHVILPPISFTWFLEYTKVNFYIEALHDFHKGKIVFRPVM